MDEFVLTLCTTVSSTAYVPKVFWSEQMSEALPDVPPKFFWKDRMMQLSSLASPPEA